MPFTTLDLNHVPLGPASTGPTSGFLENFGAAFERQHTVDSALGYEQDLHDKYVANLDEFQRLTGKPLSTKRDFFQEDMDKWDEEIKRLQKPYPHLKTFAEITQRHKNQAQAVIRRSEEVGSRAGALGFAGQLAGGIVGGTDPVRDPIYFASLFIGLGAGRTLAMKLLAEAAIGATAEAFQQGLFVFPRYEREGLEGADPWAAILYAALGGAAFRGIAEGVGVGLRAAERRIAPQRQVRIALKRELERRLGRKVDLKEAEKPISDTALVQALEELPASPERDLAITAVRHKTSVETESPYPQTREGNIQTEAEVERAVEQLEGQPPEPTTPRIPETARLDPEAARNLARSEDPEFYKRLDTAEGELDTAKAQLREIEDRIERRPTSMADAVGELDEAQGNRLREIEDELDGPVSKTKEKKLEHERRKIIGQHDNDTLEKAAQRYDQRLEIEEADAGFAVRRAEKKLLGMRKRARALERKAAKTIRDEPNPRLGATPVGEELRALGEEIDPEVIANEAVAAAEPKDGDVELGLERPVSEDTEIPQPDGTTKKLKEVLEDIKDDDALDEAVKACAIGTGGENG